METGDDADPQVLGKLSLSFFFKPFNFCHREVKQFDEQLNLKLAEKPKDNLQWFVSSKSPSWSNQMPRFT